MKQSRPAVLVTEPRAMPMMQAIAEDIDAIALTDEAAIASERDRIRGLLFAGHNKISAELMDSLPNLEIMVAPSAGIEGVDLDAARTRGITVTSGGDVGSRDVAHFAIALTLALRHHIVPSHDFVTSGAWLKGWPAARRSFRVDRVGVVGLGPIGQAVANGIAPLCGEVGWWGPRPKQLPWKRHENLMALAEWSDVLILCARSGADTAGMIDAAVLDAIGPKGSFVNIARGFMVDEDALIDALRAGRLGSAGLMPPKRRGVGQSGRERRAGYGEASRDEGQAAGRRHVRCLLRRAANCEPPMNAVYQRRVRLRGRVRYSHPG